MHIYNAEKDLEHLITNNKIIASCQLSPVEMTEEDKKILFKAIASEYDRDLYPVSTILVSTGKNKNDDIFLADELVAARCTPEHKPLNKEHKARAIVGHITKSEIVDDSLNVISEDDEDKKSECSILAEGVIYKHLGNADAELQAETEEFIDELEEGQWFVSMETLFDNFDYGIEHPTLGNAIIARNEQTSFLTRHLRSYGGTGEYEGLKIGRVLRNLTFSAEGFVKNPANPKSLVLNNKSFAAKAATMEDLGLNTNLILGENTMSEDIQKKLDEANAEINGLREKLAKADVESYITKIADLESTVAKLTEDVADRDSKINTLETKVKDAVDEVTTASENVEKLNKQLVEATKQLETAAAEQKRADRISIMVDANIDKAEAEALVDKFSNVNDEQFADIVELKKSQTAETVEPEVEADEDVEGESAAETVEVVEPKGEVSLATASSDPTSDVVAALSNFLSQKLAK